MAEKFSAMEGAWATLESAAVQDGVRSECRFGTVVGITPNMFGVCAGCGVRVDAADRVQLDRLFAAHLREIEWEASRPDPETSRRGLAAARERLQHTADMKAGGA